MTQHSSTGLAFVAIFAVLLTRIEGQNTTDDRIKTCQRAFDGSKVWKDDGAYIDADLPKWNESFAELRDRCRMFALFSQCISTFISIIREENRSYYDYLVGLDRGYTYLCSSDDDLQKLVKYQQCFQTDKVRRDEFFCNSSYMSNFNELKLIPTQKSRIDAYCSLTDTYLGCLTTSVKALCGQEAATWQKLWNEEKRIPQMRVSFECQGWKVKDNNTATIWTVVLSVVLGVTLLIMIVGIVVILFFINRKKKGLRHRSAMGVPPPPPYSTDPFQFGPCEGPAPVVTADTSEPILALPARSSNSADGSTSEQGVYVNMRPNARYPVKPPPYADQNAPAYESISGAAAGASVGGPSHPSSGGQVNEGYEETEGAKAQQQEEEEDIRPKDPESGSAPPDRNVTESERELNSNWF